MFKVSEETLTDLVEFQDKFRLWLDQYEKNESNDRAFIETAHYAKLLIYTCEQIGVDPYRVCRRAVNFYLEYKMKEHESEVA